MAKKLTTEEFISKAKDVHGDKYDYSKCVYVNAKTKVIITCNIHGDFEQTPNNHLSGKGCSGCGIETISKQNLLTTEEVITRSETKFGKGTYDYSKTLYINSKTDIIIICKTHGDIHIKFPSWIGGHGCVDCRKDKTAVPSYEYGVANGLSMVCTKCGVTKQYKDFNKKSSGNANTICTECIHKYKKDYYNKNKNHIISKSTRYYYNNKDYIKSSNMNRYYNNKTSILEQSKLYRTNRDIMDKRNNKLRLRKQNDTNFRLLTNMRSSITNRLNQKTKLDTTINLLGCTINELKIHLQKTADSRYGYGVFDINNYDGHYWHIDHIIPCVSFDLSTKEEQQKCFNYTNLQILTALDNLQKSDKFV